MTNSKIFHVLFDEKEYTCEAINIIKLAREQRFLGDEISLEEFIVEIQQNVWRLYGKSIVVEETDGLEVKCEQVVEQLIKHGLLQEVK